MVAQRRGSGSFRPLRNAAVDLYEIGVDDLFADSKGVVVDSSLGVRPPEPRRRENAGKIRA